MNSTFGNIDELMAGYGAPTLQLHPADAQARDLTDSQRVRVWNRRGSMQLTMRLSENTRPGVATILWGTGAIIPAPMVSSTISPARRWPTWRRRHVLRLPG